MNKNYTSEDVVAAILDESNEMSLRELNEELTKDGLPTTPTRIDQFCINYLNLTFPKLKSYFESMVFEDRGCEFMRFDDRIGEAIAQNLNKKEYLGFTFVDDLCFDDFIYFAYDHRQHCFLVGRTQHEIMTVMTKPITAKKIKKLEYWYHISIYNLLSNIATLQEEMMQRVLYRRCMETIFSENKGIENPDTLIEKLFQIKLTDKERDFIKSLVKTKYCRHATETDTLIHRKVVEELDMIQWNKTIAIWSNDHA